jgi:hypothetical protein
MQRIFGLLIQTYFPVIFFKHFKRILIATIIIKI